MELDECDKIYCQYCVFVVDMEVDGSMSDFSVLNRTYWSVYE